MTDPTPAAAVTAAHPVLRHFAGLRQLVKLRHQCDFGELERALEALEADLRRALHHCHASTPTRVTVTATQEGHTTMSFAPGKPITFTAVSDNTENVPVTDTYTWTTTAGTIVPGADSTTVTISDAPLGDTTVTATDPAGHAGAVTVTVADQTPATVTVTAA